MSLRTAILSRLRSSEVENALQAHITIKQFQYNISKHITATLFINNIIYVGTNDHFIYIIDAQNMSLIKQLHFQLKQQLIPYSVIKLLYYNKKVFVFFQQDIFQIDEDSLDITKHYKLPSHIIPQSIAIDMGVLIMKLQNNATATIYEGKLSFDPITTSKKVLSYQYLQTLDFTIQLKNGTVHHKNKIIIDQCLYFKYFPELSILATVSIQSQHRIVLFQYDKKRSEFTRYNEILLNISATFSQEIILYKNILIIGTQAPKLQGTSPGLILYDVVSKYEKWLNIPVQSSVCGNLSVHNVNSNQIVVCGNNQVYVMEFGQKTKFSSGAEEPVIQEGLNQLEILSEISLFKRDKQNNDLSITPITAKKYLECLKAFSNVKVTKFSVGVCTNQVMFNGSRHQTTVFNSTQNISQFGSFIVSTPPLLNQSQGLMHLDFKE